MLNHDFNLRHAFSSQTIFILCIAQHHSKVLKYAFTEPLLTMLTVTFNWK